MFNNIAGRYDFLNRFLSFWIDEVWRKKTVAILEKYNCENVLDVACGTADLSIRATKNNENLKFHCIDLAEKMIKIAEKKVKKKNYKNFTFQVADAKTIKLKENYFDAIIIGFGVRNFENIEATITNLRKALKMNCPIIILEFAIPSNILFKTVYLLYFKYLLPIISSIFSKDKFAYKYLKESVLHFPYGAKFVKILQKIGFSNCRYKKINNGIVYIYVGEKNETINNDKKTNKNRRTSFV